MKMKKGFLVPVALCYSISCQAFEYIFEPVFNSNERYESNLFMQQIAPKQGNWISTLSPALNFGLRHDTGELKSTFTWNQLLYNNQSELNRAEQLFSSNYQHKYQRITWSLGSSYNNQSSINSQTTPSGILSTPVTNKNLSLSPSVSYTLDELNTLSFNYSYNKATYGKAQNSIQKNLFLSDYTNQQASTSLSHVYSERDTFNASLSGTLYKSQIQNTHNYVSQLGWQHRFSEQLSTYVSGGINYSQAESQTLAAQLAQVNFHGTVIYVDPFTNIAYPQQRYATITTQRNNFGKVYSASITKSFEKGSISLSGAQNQSPSAIGLQTQQSLSINTSYTINERWTSGLSASYNKTDISGQSNSTSNRTYYSLSPNVNWKCSPEINMSLSYTYRQQEYQGSTQPTQGNTIQLNFSYQPQINLR
jgi:outer membrane protein assembly factor BamA